MIKPKYKQTQWHKIITILMYYGIYTTVENVWGQ